MLLQELLGTTALTEVKMSYSSLMKRADQIKGARVGMEFEMYVPGVTEDQEPDYEPDYSVDEYISTGTWGAFEKSVADFFRSGDFSDYTQSQITRIVNGDIRDDFDDWVETNWREWAEGELEDWYLRENPDEEELPPKGTRAYERAMDEFRDAQFEYWMDDSDRIEDWLKEKRMEKFSQLANSYDLSWPHMRDANEDSNKLNLYDLARDFGRAVGMSVDHSSEYHTATRRKDSYVVEPDGSLDSPEGPGDTGLEFVSPPMGIEEMIAQLNKVKRWAGRVGAYANDSTGLHINVSLPGYSTDKLDYIKLALFLGDDWVSEQFDRLGNRYARSSIDQIKSKIRRTDLNMEGVFNLMKSGLANMASKIIHSGETEKYVSINTKNNRIEFRSPGGDWLDANYDKIIGTMLRFIVAMDIAMDPDKEKQEYAKKLYKLVGANVPKEDLDTLRYFAQYSAGALPSGALKSFVRNIQQKRAEKKLFPATTARPKPPGDQLRSDEKAYVIRDARTNEVRHEFAAVSPGAALRYGNEWAGRFGMPPTSIKVELAQPDRPGQTVGTYKITYSDPFGTVGRTDSVTLSANSRRAAVEEFRSVMPNHDIINVEQIR